MELLGSATSDDQGRWQLPLPLGDYTVLMESEGESLVENLQTSIEGARELNLIYPGGE